MTQTHDPTAAAAEATAERQVHEEGRWKFDEGAGDIAADSSERGHTLTGPHGFGWTTGADFGGAIALDGTLQTLATSGAVLRTDRDFTVAAWVRLDSATLNGALRPASGEHAWTAVSQGVTSHAPFYLGARLFSEPRPDGATEAVLRWSFTVSPIDGPTSAFEWRHAKSAAPVDAGSLDRWVLLVGVHDAQNHAARLYVPGVGDVSTEALPEGWTHWHGDAPLQVGHGSWLGETVDHWPGSIGQIRVFSGALTADEVANLHSKDTLT